jgi:nitrous oxide reductase
MNTTTKLNAKIRNYGGQNDFVRKMKQVVFQYGGLTEKQAEAVEKALSEPTKVDTRFLSDNTRQIADYAGENTFVLDVKGKFLKYGTLSDAQVSAANKQIKKENEDKNRMDVNIDVIGETIVVGRNTGEDLKKQKGLNFNPLLLDIT